MEETAFPLQDKQISSTAWHKREEENNRKTCQAGDSSSQLPRIILGLQLPVSTKFKELAVLKVYSKNVTREFKFWPCKEKFHGDESKFPGYQGFCLKSSHDFPGSASEQLFQKCN